jgi:5-methylcytosine-specific restriction enzyme A
MPNRSLRPCKRSGCRELTRDRNGYCTEHVKEYEDIQKQNNSIYDKSRGNSTERGYTARWQRYSKWFLKQPGNQICKLHLNGCTLIATCVDHIDPPNNKDDPRFWETSNHQASCIHCNSVKGHKKIKGEYEWNL